MFKTPQIAKFRGQHGANLGPVGPRWAPCWPHEPCYKDLFVSMTRKARVSLKRKPYQQWVPALQWRHNERHGVSVVYSTVCSGADQIKPQSSASLAFVRGIHRWPVNSYTKGQLCGKCFHLMTPTSWAMFIRCQRQSLAQAVGLCKKTAK